LLQKNNIPVSEEIIATTNQLQSQNSVDVRKRLILLIDQLIDSDFHGLVQLLYQIDVQEQKLNEALKDNLDNDSAPLIADLIIERQLQKIESRKQFSSGKNKDSKEEKW
jgi:hypothetical protein